MQARRARGFIDRSMVWVLVAAVAAGLGLWAAQVLLPASREASGVKPSATAPSPPAPALRTVRLFAESRELPPFRLETATGSFGPADVQGRWTVVFLGFSHCPDVCPTTLAQLAKAQDAWEPLPEATRPQVLFVSVDPERDTPKALATYASFFHPATRAATAAEPALGEFVQSIGMVYMKVPQDGGDYMMDHSNTLVVLDPQGRQAGLIRPPLDAAAIAADLAQLAGTQAR
jgi:protein SCO1/2